MRAEEFLEALLCGFLVALTAALFVEYFGVADVGIFWGIAGGLLIVNFLLLLLIAWPFRFSGVIVFFVITLILGYAAYGPYATAVREPMMKMGESMKEFPPLAEKQMHCLALIFTNPMAYQQECVLTTQPKAEEEQPEDYGLEITEFKVQPEPEIYAGMPFQVRMVLENKGDYDATNFVVKTDGGEYEECSLTILNVTGEDGKEKEEIPPKTDHHYGARGLVNDPWKTGCTYARNKMVIGGTLKTNYYYNYQTESYLEMDIIKSIEEPHNFRVESAKEKAAPANVLMYTFVPLIWEGAGDSFRQGIVPVSFKNERNNGKIIFRGKKVYEDVILTEEKLGAAEWCKKVCAERSPTDTSCQSDCTSSFEEKDKRFRYCAVLDKSGKVIAELEGVGEKECNSDSTKIETARAGEYDERKGEWSPTQCKATTTIVETVEGTSGESGGGNGVAPEESPYCSGFSGSYTYKHSLLGDITIDCSICEYMSFPNTCDCGPESLTGYPSRFISKDVLSSQCVYTAPPESETSGGTQTPGETTETKTETKINTIEVSGTLKCEDLKLAPSYRLTGTYDRNTYDKITIYLVGDTSKYVTLSCGEDSSDNIVDCSGGGNQVELVWNQDEVILNPSESRFIYSGVVVSLVGQEGSAWPNPDAIDFNFGVKADATYRVEMTSSQYLKILTPHYTSR